MYNKEKKSVSFALIQDAQMVFLFLGLLRHYLAILKHRTTSLTFKKFNHLLCIRISTCFPLFDEHASLGLPLPFAKMHKVFPTL